MNEYTAYREGYSDGFNDGVEYMQKQFVKNYEEAKERQSKRFSEWREKIKHQPESENRYENKNNSNRDRMFSK